MKRQRVAVLGIGGLFEATLIETLASQSWLLVREFQTEEPEVIRDRIVAFGPQAVIVVNGHDGPISQAVRLLSEEGVPIVRLDPASPALNLSLTASNASATLDRVLEIIHAAASLSPVGAPKSRKAPRAREVPHVGPSIENNATDAKAS